LGAVWVPPAHDATTHVVPAGYFWHAPVPTAHVPSFPHDAAPWAVQALAQQIPFAPQIPLEQSVPPSAGLHPPPFCPLPTQAPPAQ
jgi:hypothetical protein